MVKKLLGHVKHDLWSILKTVREKTTKKLMIDYYTVHAVHDSHDIAHETSSSFCSWRLAQKCILQALCVLNVENKLEEQLLYTVPLYASYTSKPVPSVLTPRNIVFCQRAFPIQGYFKSLLR